MMDEIKRFSYYGVYRRRLFVVSMLYAGGILAAWPGELVCGEANAVCGIATLFRRSMIHREITSA
jgi:hypothetical protein